MRILVFDLVGATAHFRKFYTNSSSLSYDLPPRTVLSGLIAAVLGIERDQYYTLLQMDKAKLAVRALYPQRKLIQTVNYMFVTSSSQLNRSAGNPYQVPVELNVPIGGMGVGKVGYRVFFSHEDERLLDRLASLLREGKSSYPPYLGISECVASIEWVGEYTESQVTRVEPSDEVQFIATLVPIKAITRVAVHQAQGQMLKYRKDTMPFAFSEGRVITHTGQALYEQQGQPMALIVHVPTYQIQADGFDERILFLEEGMSQ